MTAAPLVTTPSLVVVTGGSTGIGLELALEASRAGHHVLLVARGAGALEAAAAACADAGAPATFVVAADLATAAGVERVVSEVESIDLPLAALVNNAGVGAWGPFADQDADRVGAMVDLNARAVVVLTRRLLDRVREARGGILTVASTAAFQPGPGMAVYHATKAFALWFSMALREELRGSGVRVSALCPGPVPTGFAGAAGLDAMEDMRMARLAAQPADKVARLAWRGLARNEAIVVPGAVNRVGSLAAKVLPMSIVTRVTRTALGAIDRTGAAKPRG